MKTIKRLSLSVITLLVLTASGIGALAVPVEADDGYTCSMKAEPTSFDRSGTSVTLTNNEEAGGGGLVTKDGEPVSASSGYYIHLYSQDDAHVKSFAGSGNDVDIQDGRFEHELNLYDFIEEHDERYGETKQRLIYAKMFKYNPGSPSTFVCQTTLTVDPAYCGMGSKVYKKEDGSGFYVVLAVEATGLIPDRTYNLKVDGLTVWSTNVSFPNNGQTRLFLDYGNDVSGQSHTIRLRSGNAAVNGCHTTLNFNPNADSSNQDDIFSKYPEVVETTGFTGNANFELCHQAEDFMQECVDCSNRNGVWTALGCVPTNISDMFRGLFRIGLGLAGGFAMLLIIYGGFTISTSSGDPQKLQNGQEIVTAAIIGLLLIIFSAVILRFVGVDLLAIPGFS